MRRPPLEHVYAANVVLVILALFPGLINTSAVALAAPVIGADLGVPADRVGALPLYSDAALAFGALLAADLVRRFDGRAMFRALIVLSAVTSAVSALASNFGVLLAAHVVHGLVAGTLFIVMLPPLLLNFGSGKLRSSATVLVPSLFGAATLGPLAGAAVAEPGVWRTLFGVETLVAAVVLALGAFTFAERPPPDPHAPVDWYAHIVSGCAALAIFAGAGQLAGHDWSYPPAAAPVALGVVMFAALVAGEYLRPNALVPVRGLSTSIALVGIIATVIGSACFAALSELLTLALERLNETGVRGAGLALWPEFVSAGIAGFVFGRLVTTKWVALLGVAGLALCGVAAGVAMAAQPIDRGDAGIVAFVAGLGAGLAVTPGLFVVALTYERKLVARAIAMLNLLRLTGGFISAPGVEHSVGTRAREHLVALGGAHGDADRVMRDFITTGQIAPGTSHTALQSALLGGIGDGFLIVLLLAVAGVIATAAILVLRHTPLRAPDLRRFDEGRPSLVTT